MEVRENTAALSKHVTAHRGAHTFFLDKPQIVNTAVGAALGMCQCHQHEDILPALSSHLIGTIGTQSLSNFSVPQSSPEGKELIYIQRPERS